MRFTVLCATLTMLASTAAGCGYDNSGPASPPPAPQPDGLWTASASPEGILRLAPSQLSGTGDLVPARTITTPSARISTLVGMAFDETGSLWVASQDDSLLLRFGQASLATSGSTAATAVIAPTAGSLSGPTSLAFDAAHRLWVANRSNGTLVRFDPAQLAAGGDPAPPVILSGLGLPTAIAFDAAGSLWVSDSRANTVAKYSATDLAASGSPAPTVLLSSAATSLVKPSGLAFDASGNLWVANTSLDNLVAFSPDQLVHSGSPAPHLVIGVIGSNAESVVKPVGLAFDGGGSLWVVGGGGSLIEYAAASLQASGTPEPRARLQLAGRSLFWSVAFWPKPPGLPIN